MASYLQKLRPKSKQNDPTSFRETVVHNAPKTGEPAKPSGSVPSPPPAPAISEPADETGAEPVLDEEDEKFDWEGGGTNSDHEDVGWMYVDASDYVDVQDQLQGEDFWPELYVRPPLMRWEEDFNRAPGFWRRNMSSA